jgi:predicted dehydrogenase
VKPDILIVGGGMTTHDQLLPSFYHLQRLGRVGAISVCAQRARTLQDLASSAILAEAFPGQGFRAFPESGDLDRPHPELFREVIASLAPHSIVAAAVPDQLHFDVIMTALQHDQHVCAVKPLVLKYRDAL